MNQHDTDYHLFQTGQITHEEFLQRERNQMPRCVNHSGRAAHGRIPDGYVCEECAAAWVAVSRLLRKSQSLIVGGLEGL